jgi:hypothetical protein
MGRTISLAISLEGRVGGAEGSSGGPVGATDALRAGHDELGAKSVGRFEPLAVCKGVCKDQQQQQSRRPHLRRTGSFARSRRLGISTSRQAGSTRPCGLVACLAIA